MIDKFRVMYQLKDIYLKRNEELANNPISPYVVIGKLWDDVYRCMTPIELNLWSELRFLGLTYYPEYPIGKYFVDFGNPIKKVVIEADGKEYHTKQYEIKDQVRQKEIESLGWKVIRVKGKETYQDNLAKLLAKRMKNYL